MIFYAKKMNDSVSFATYDRNDPFGFISKNDCCNLDWMSQKVSTQPKCSFHTKVAIKLCDCCRKPVICLDRNNFFLKQITHKKPALSNNFIPQLRLLVHGNVQNVIFFCIPFGSDQKACTQRLNTGYYNNSSHYKNKRQQRNT